MYFRRGWSKEQREFCVEQYYLNYCLPLTVRRLFCEKYGVIDRDIEEKCPSVRKIKKWVAIHEQDKEVGSYRGIEEKRRRASSKENVHSVSNSVQSDFSMRRRLAKFNTLHGTIQGPYYHLLHTPLHKKRAGWIF